jgi:DNA-binding transcriptional MocR family regulator
MHATRSTLSNLVWLGACQRATIGLIMSPQISSRSLHSLLGPWNEGGNLPAYQALAERIRLLILDGRIPSESRLPAERELAVHLELSRSTITSAYARLREQGYLNSVQGSGSVATIPATRPIPTLAGLRDVLSPSILTFTEATLPAAPMVADAFQQVACSFAEHLETRGYEPTGLLALREAIADRYVERGVATHPDQIMVTSGALQAISLLGQALLARGDRVVVETPTYPHAMDALVAAGGRLVPVPVASGSGWDEDNLLNAFGRTGAPLAYLMPDFQNPTAESMSNELRQRIVDVAARHGALVISDETTAELDIDRPGSFAPMAAFGDVVSVGSASKVMWGGLRVGWVRASRSVIRRLVAVRARSDLGTPPFEQLVVAQLLRAMPELLESRREPLRQGRDFLRQCLEEALPEWRSPELHGGLTSWINLGRPISSELVLAARASGVVFAAGPRFGIDGAFERFLRLPTSYSPAETVRAVSALRTAWERVAARDPRAERDLEVELV